jgi:L-aspartate oxidase
MMGGVKTDLEGMTTVPGLFAAGEVACTGVHGANRLASNSLLEGLVYGCRAGVAAAVYSAQMEPTRALKRNSETGNSMRDSLDLGEIRTIIRRTMWENSGIVRSAESLDTARKTLLDFREILDMDFATRAGLEVKSMLITALSITEAAILRKGSVGGHYRSDYPQKEGQWQRHTNIRGIGHIMEVKWT